jgi:class 3 adenylate cyclase
MRHRGLHTFLFADLVGFTSLAELHGDDVAADVAVRFGGEAARLAAEHGARVIKALGDAVMVRSDSAADALAFGMRLHDELAEIPGMPAVHAGAHTGRAVERDGDWFGAAVNLAARVSAAARGGELLVTEATVAAAGAVDGVELECLGPQTFKNVSVPTSVYSARPAAPRRALHGLRPLPAPVAVPASITA